MQAHSKSAGAASRGLFTVVILSGSFLLFLVQPMVARFALPQLGGAPGVWNSAMLVFQVLLLGGYAYAHALSRLCCWLQRRRYLPAWRTFLRRDRAGKCSGRRRCSWRRSGRCSSCFRPRPR
jgi:hypothetical protein